LTTSQYKYYFGGLLYSICDGLGIPKEDREKASRRIHASIKKCFEIDSFTSLSSKDFEKIAGIIRMIGCREWAYMIKEADEEKYDPNQLSMKDFLKKKNLV
jgi:serine/threonine protein phosphatase PrpC